MADFSLILVSTEERVKALALSAKEDPRAAEKLLCELADAKGDEAIVELLEQSSPLTLAAIFSEHDAGSETIISYLASPSQIARALAMEPARWEAIDKKEALEALWVLKGVRGMIISLLYHRSFAEREQIIQAVWENEESAPFLVLSMIDLDLKNLPEEESEAAPGTAEMIWWWVAEVLPDVAAEICHTLIGKRIGVWEAVATLREEAISRLIKSETSKPLNLFKPL